MIRKAIANDVEAINQSYTELLTYEQNAKSHSNWQLGVYPTRSVPEAAIPQGTMYVLEEEGELCASMILNHAQSKEYAQIPWEYPAAPEKVLVLHTLCIPPSRAKKGYGTQMVDFAKETARTAGCTVIRLDTYAQNEPAKRLYTKNGFRIAGYAQALHQGVIQEEQVYLEYKLSPSK